MPHMLSLTPLLLLSSLFACSMSPPEPPREPLTRVGHLDLRGRQVEGRDIILIVLDTLRRDYSGGYRPDVMPRLEAWSKGARVFENARAASSWTLPSHATMLTGLPPSEHEARGAPPTSGRSATPLKPRTRTITQRLQRARYATAAVLANRAFLHKSWGLWRGFTRYHCSELPADAPALYPDAQRITDMAIEVLGRPRTRPIFLMLNYLDAHAPWIDRSGPQSTSAPMPYSESYRTLESAILTGEPLDPGISAQWKSSYEAELRYLDHHLGRLLSELPSLGVDDDDLVVITSDHGEHFGEHGLLLHRRGLHRETLDIPMILRGPGHEPGRDPTPVGHANIPTWIAAAADVRPVGHTPTDLRVSELFWARSGDLTSDALRERFDGIHRAFATEGHVLLQRDDAAPHGFDWARDPGEEDPVSESSWLPQLVERSRAWRSAHPVSETRRASDDAPDLEALRALGYVD